MSDHTPDLGHLLDTVAGLAPPATRPFLNALAQLVPELAALFARHRGDIRAMREELRDSDARLALRREITDAALAAKAARETTGTE